MPKTVSLPELWHTAVVEWHEQAPFRNTLGRKLFEGVLQVLYRHLSSKSFLEGSYHLTYLLGMLMDELDPEVSNPSSEPQLEVFYSSLCLSAEDRIAAAHIRHHRMPSSGFVLQGYPVRFTRVPAVRIVSAC
jgi:hypothetical protein